MNGLGKLHARFDEGGQAQACPLLYPTFCYHRGRLSCARARTPAPIVKKLSSEIATIVKLPEVRDALLGANLDPVGSDKEEFARTIANDFKTWAAVAKAANIQINQ